MDIWDQVPLCAYWNDQIKQFILLRLPLVRKDRRFFCAIRLSCGRCACTSAHKTANVHRVLQHEMCASRRIRKMILPYPIAEMENLKMNRYLLGHNDKNVLPSGEIKETEIIADNQTLMNNKAV